MAKSGHSPSQLLESRSVDISHCSSSHHAEESISALLESDLSYDLHRPIEYSRSDDVPVAHLVLQMLACLCSVS